MHRPTKPSNPPGLRQRLIVALFVPLLLILLVSSLFDYRLARKTADAAHDQALADSIFDLEAHLRKQPAPGIPDLTEESEAMLRSNAPDLLFFAIRDASGKVIAGDTDLPAITPPTGDLVQFSDGYYREKTVRIAVHRIRIENSTMQVVVLETTEKRRLSSQRILTAMVLPNLAVVFATLLAVLFGVRHGLLPLNKVEREIAARSASDLREINLNDAPQEIRPMLRRLNELFVMLRESSELQQRFIADAAHQLRTPLAGLQTQIDLALGEGAFDHNDERHRRIEDASTRISHLLNQLLSYARTETAGAHTAPFEAVALDQLLENSATAFIDAALAKNIDLGFEITPAAAQGQPWMLQEALANLIDNAIRYTPPGGTITVRCGLTGQQPYLEVEDSGPGIPLENRQQVFERFYRLPGSPGNGCGLGLPIVSEIAHLHGASIVLDDGALGGLNVLIRFPPATT